LGRCGLSAERETGASPGNWRKDARRRDFREGVRRASRRRLRWRKQASTKSSSKGVTATTVTARTAKARTETTVMCGINPPCCAEYLITSGVWLLLRLARRCRRWHDLIGSSQPTAIQPGQLPAYGYIDAPSRRLVTDPTVDYYDSRDESRPDPPAEDDQTPWDVLQYLISAAIQQVLTTN
jgi:hypothetical protein